MSLSPLELAVGAGTLATVPIHISRSDAAALTLGGMAPLVDAKPSHPLVLAAAVTGTNAYPISSVPNVLVVEIVVEVELELAA